MTVPERDTPMGTRRAQGTRQYVALIDGLLTRPIGDEGFHLLPLCESGDFHAADDAWDEVMRSAEDFDGRLRELAAVLDVRWGPHRSMSMEDYALMDPEEPEEGEAPPPFFRALCEYGYFGDLLYWQSGDRHVAVSVGHQDKEEPMVLFAAVVASAEGFPP